MSWFSPNKNCQRTCVEQLRYGYIIIAYDLCQFYFQILFHLSYVEILIKWQIKYSIMVADFHSFFISVISFKVQNSSSAQAYDKNSW